MGASLRNCALDFPLPLSRLRRFLVRRLTVRLCYRMSHCLGLLCLLSLFSRSLSFGSLAHDGDGNEADEEECYADEDTLHDINELDF